MKLGTLVNFKAYNAVLDTGYVSRYDEDPEYRLKRNRRLIRNAFFRVCKTKYMRIVTEKFGPVFVDVYPTERSNEEILEEEDLCDHDDFVSVFIPPVNARYMKKKEASKKKTIRLRKEKKK